MILDALTLFCDDMAFGGTPNVIDLDEVAPNTNPRPGPGQPLKIFVAGSKDLAGVTGFDVLDGPTSSPANALLSWTGDLAGGVAELHLPSDVDRYVTIALAGTPSAGTVNAGIVMDVQTNQ